MRRFLVVAFAVAIGAALAVLPALAAFDPALRRASALFMQYLACALSRGAVDPDAFVTAGALARFAWTAAVSVCVVPLVVVALVGEAAGIRSALWHIGATGLLAAAAPWIARAAFGASRVVTTSSQELHFALVFFVTGATAGAVYWLLAGRGGRDPSVVPD
ncbi:hypothetical protein [Methylocella sp.]|uniref:hypothetical protein n=1 Tax=Methylocella sp. TaxID=1978226 RepID=UPI0035B4AF79